MMADLLFEEGRLLEALKIYKQVRAFIKVDKCYRMMLKKEPGNISL
jgi:hypothetical protein